MKTYSLVREPRPLELRNLLMIGMSEANELLLVERPELGLSANGRAFLDSLSGELIEKAERSEWPGTALMGGVAWVYRYRVTEDLCRKFLAACDQLYGWRQPAFPEDPCLLRTEGEPWLVTISHERDAYLSLTETQARDVRSVVPELLAE